MRQYNHIYSSNDSFGAFLENKAIPTESKGVLVQIFSSVKEIAKIEKIVSDIVTIMPHATIVGTSTAGEIVNGIMYEDITALLRVLQKSYSILLMMC